MSTAAISKLVEAAFAESVPWLPERLEALSSQCVPDAVFGGWSSMLRGDARRLWTEWFVTAFADPFSINASRFAHCYALCSESVDREFPQASPEERRSLAFGIARALGLEAKRRNETGRGIISRKDRQQLLADAGVQPRCWICGYAFSGQIVDAFADGVRASPSLPLFLDAWRPHGRNPRDVGIEVDHVLAVHEGGEGESDNLRLACGWCNVHKGARSNIYEVAARASRVFHPRWGQIAVPWPFWVVRMMALRRGCEYPDGCSRRAEDCALRIAPRRFGGDANPMNCWICCPEHDPIREWRFVPRGSLRDK